MSIYYSNERNVQILLEVLKANNIRKIIVSPGATNVSFVASANIDPFFELYSAVDERGAAYMACGLAAESGEAVVISCTGATASRNYYPALTEAFHKKLPILAVTASQDFSISGHLSPQFTDRTSHPTDALRLSVQVPIVRSETDEWDCNIKINKAVLELFRHGGGPVHINIASSYSDDFDVKKIPYVRTIKRYIANDKLPNIESYKRIAIAVGAHKFWSEELTQIVDEFCEKYDALVFVDHSSSYWGKYRVLPTLVSSQESRHSKMFDTDLLIHIGEEHGDYYTAPRLGFCKEVWRISEDGEIRDSFKKLTNVFEMKEIEFFEYYCKAKTKKSNNDYFASASSEMEALYSEIGEIPFSNIWIAQQVTSLFPKNASMHLGVSNTMRSWTFFDFPKNTYTMANTGCRGIDGAIATAIGMSIATPSKLHFAVMGDLTFFYGLNALGNRNVKNNLRIMLINNGCGAEFNIYQHRAYKIYDGCKEDINKYIAAGDHYYSKSTDVVMHFAQDLGYTYLRASSKDEFSKNLPMFLQEKEYDKPIIFEVFTNTKDESDALKIIRNLKVDKALAVKNKIADALGDKTVSKLRKFIK